MKNMIAIQVRFLGPTNYKGARVSITCAIGRKILPYNHALGCAEDTAVHALREAGCPPFARTSSPKGAILIVDMEHSGSVATFFGKGRTK